MLVPYRAKTTFNLFLSFSFNLKMIGFIVCPLRKVVYLLNFILETFKNDEKVISVKLDKFEVKKSDFKPVSEEIVEISENKFMNLKAVKEIEFVQLLTPEESVQRLERQVDLMRHTI